VKKSRWPIGLYEELINLAVDEDINASLDDLVIDRVGLHPAKAPDRLALYFGGILSKVVAGIPENQRIEASRKLINQLIDLAHQHSPNIELSAQKLLEDVELLRGIYPVRQDGNADKLRSPLTPLLDTVLVTNDHREPNIAAQIKREICSADRIDILMAFVRKSGIRKFLADFEKIMVRDDPPQIRLLTTTYTQSTELEALKILKELGANIRISYDEGMTRLHAKAWYFHRNSGATTGYIGSSNLTYSAQETGMEWNVRVSALRNPDVTRKMASVFEAYWESDDFVDFDEAEFSERVANARVPKAVPRLDAYLDVTLKPFQARLLEQISLARLRGETRNLLVSATGTGKTVMAACDFMQLKKELSRSRLLFVAHRKEILTQSRDTFRLVLKDWSFGELWVDGERPDRFDHVFASIQSLNTADLSRLAPDHYDVVIVDEFHHAAAASYQRLLNHLEPQQLLALTATPERTDGQSLLNLVGGKISAEFRLWDAIDQKSLVPFEYYGIHDGSDLTHVGWRRGQGYDIEELSNVFTANNRIAKRILTEVTRRTADLSKVAGLGFCVSVKHAEFMAEQFNRAGVAAAAVSGKTSRQHRDYALKKLQDGGLRFVFSVDLFNEGVDIPRVNTLLLMRPTESATIFIQQLGRGLRRDQDKSVCTVFDFVGQHRREFRFDLRYRGLLGQSRRQLEEQVKEQFPYLPAGCYMELDDVSQEVVLRSLRNSLPSGRSALKRELIALVSQFGDLGFEQFLDHTGLTVDDVYAGSGSTSWSDLREEAELEILPAGPFEGLLRRSITRLSHVDDLERLECYQVWLNEPVPPLVQSLNEREKRLLRMLVASLCDQIKENVLSLQDAVGLIWDHPQVLSELAVLFKICEKKVSHQGHSYSVSGDIPLRVHARYTRIEILAAFGEGNDLKTPTWREGVRWSEANMTDILVFTLSKTPGKFSPSTMYKDYAISRELIHWESQSMTSAQSKTGQRYQNHLTDGTSIALFARETSNDRAFWFLGNGRYVSHEGSRPMAITWRLDHSLPGDLYSSFISAVA